MRVLRPTAQVGLARWLSSDLVYSPARVEWSVVAKVGVYRQRYDSVEGSSYEGYLASLRKRKKDKGRTCIGELSSQVEI